MAQTSPKAVPPSVGLPRPRAITQLEVSGFKSIADDRAIDIRPLTLLSGTNSSGKSSMLQPLLLLKQTLEANFDPGPLLLTGANVKFNSAEQPFSRSSKSRVGTQFSCAVIAGHASCRWEYTRAGKKAIDLTAMKAGFGDELISLRRGMSMSDYAAEGNRPLAPSFGSSGRERSGFGVTRRGIFLDALAQFIDGRADGQVSAEAVRVQSGAILGTLSQLIRSAIHLPGLRGNAERNYPVTAIGPTFPGTFEAYTASVIATWQEENNTERLDGLRRDLEELGLTWTVEASAVNATAVEVLVGRLPKPSRRGAVDLVSIADVGVGVSQTLPVLVALQQALPGQLVYIEQPEIHLHPRAQAAMAAVLVRAAKRGVRVVAETHSSHILTGVQSLVAEGEIAPEDVVLHWFTRDTKGATQIATANLDESGAYGDWPEDFSETTLDAQDRYIRAAFEKLPPRAS